MFLILFVLIFGTRSFAQEINFRGFSSPPERGHSNTELSEDELLKMGYPGSTYTNYKGGTGSSEEVTPLTPQEIQESYHDSLVNLKGQSGLFKPEEEYPQSYQHFTNFPQTTPAPQSFQNYGTGYPDYSSTYTQQPLVIPSKGSVQSVPISLQQLEGFSLDVSYPQGGTTPSQATQDYHPPPHPYIGGGDGSHLKANFRPSEPDLSKYPESSQSLSSFNTPVMSSGFQPSFGPPPPPPQYIRKQQIGNEIPPVKVTEYYHHPNYPPFIEESQKIVKESHPPHPPPPTQEYKFVQESPPHHPPPTQEYKFIFVKPPTPPTEAYLNNYDKPSQEILYFPSSSSSSSSSQDTNSFQHLFPSKRRKRRKDKKRKTFYSLKRGREPLHHMAKIIPEGNKKGYMLAYSPTNLPEVEEMLRSFTGGDFDSFGSESGKFTRSTMSKAGKKKVKEEEEENESSSSEEEEGKKRKERRRRRKERRRRRKERKRDEEEEKNKTSTMTERPSSISTTLSTTLSTTTTEKPSTTLTTTTTPTTSTTLETTTTPTTSSTTTSPSTTTTQITSTTTTPTTTTPTTTLSTTQATTPTSTLTTTTPPPTPTSSSSISHKKHYDHETTSESRRSSRESSSSPEYSSSEGFYYDTLPINSSSSPEDPSSSEEEETILTTNGHQLKVFPIFLHENYEDILMEDLLSEEKSSTGKKDLSILSSGKKNRKKINASLAKELLIKGKKRVQKVKKDKKIYSPTFKNFI